MSFMLIFIWSNVCRNKMLTELLLSTRTRRTTASPNLMVTIIGSRVGASTPSVSKFRNTMSSLIVFCCLSGAPSSIAKQASFGACFSKLAYRSTSPHLFCAGWGPPEIVLITSLWSVRRVPSPLDPAWFPRLLRTWDPTGWSEFCSFFTNG